MCDATIKALTTALVQQNNSPGRYPKFNQKTLHQRDKSARSRNYNLFALLERSNTNHIIRERHTRNVTAHGQQEWGGADKEVFRDGPRALLLGISLFPLSIQRFPRSDPCIIANLYLVVGIGANTSSQCTKGESDQNVSPAT